MRGWTSTIDKTLLLPCASLFFEHFLDVLQNTNKEFAIKFTKDMVPDYANEDEMVLKIQELVGSIPEGHPATVKSLNESVDSMVRTSRGKKLSQEIIDSLV